MRQHFIHLFEYNDWANKLAAASINETRDINPKAISVFAHIVNAQQLWLGRIQGKPGVKPWDERSLDESIILASQNTKEWIEFLRNITDADLEKSINFQNTKGDVFSNKIYHIINQVLGHSSYHRGQIAFMVRNSDRQPALTDYIVYIRQNKISA